MGTEWGTVSWGGPVTSSVGPAAEFPGHGRPPTAAILFGGAGALLIAIESFAYLAFARQLGAYTWGSWAVNHRALGAAGMTEAIALVAVIGGLYLVPRSHAAWGVLMITLALLSLYAGGGFVLGAVLGWVGGVLAIGYRSNGWLPGGRSVSPRDVEEDPVIEADLADAEVLGPTGPDPASPARDAR